MVKRLPRQDFPDPDNGGYLVVPEVMPEQQFIEQQMFLNRFRTNPELREDPALYARNAAYDPSSH